MSQEESQAPATNIQSAPHSWIAVLLGITGLALGALLTGALILRFLDDRPLDLRQVSESATNELEQLLLANRVPQENVALIESEDKRNDEAYWNYYHYRVRLPHTLSKNGVEQLIERAMRRRMVMVSDFLQGGEKQGLSLAVGNHTFADVEFIESAPPMNPEDTPPSQAASTAPETESLTKPMQSKESGTSTGEEAGEPSSDMEAEAQEVDEAKDEAEMEPVEPPDDLERPWRPPSRPGTTDAEDRTQVGAAMKAEARLAIIVDDGGYGGETTQSILALDPNLTLSILPYTPHGLDTAKRAAERGFEVLLHMPMENTDPGLRHDGQLAITMNESKIAELTLAALKQVPGAAGINNHMGSKFTTNPKAMALFLASIQDKSLFFVDSRTTAKSRAYAMAQAFGIRSAKSDLFLDNSDDPEKIMSRFNQLTTIALQQGHAVGICHFRPSTAQVLATAIPKLDKLGIQLVHASELVQ